ncbi:phosphatidylinositol-specific phospholipase C domain-containing protein [Bacillus thuringiensis]|uniref:1-phosphatidylinositol phosphodiesterase n=1 Tax=Bacillus thuringiensis subsp. jegathesan TaxID=56955 RepID=A0A9X6QUA5_BACTJ|nr:phosphatidylinositol-specific phospholipase C domain-containing protein [Bacillus thuringiensis]OUB57313.1 hypothetical protein BK750_32335 [Bacillus thuringiensis serovar jegathesan]
MKFYDNQTSFIDSPFSKSSYPNYVDINGQLTMDRSGFDVNHTVHYRNKDWMNYIPDYYRISELSIPGTHGSMALYGGILGDSLINQTMNLDMQLISGIRYIDIRCRHYYDTFTIHHDLVYQNANFDDVLMSLISFLTENPRETILMRVKEEYTPVGNTRTFGETFESYWKKGEKYFWNPYTSINPTLGDVRGKIILLQNFQANKTFGINWNYLTVQDMWELDGSSQIYAKWEKVKDYFFRAMQNKSQIYLNHLSANGRLDTLGDPKPWFVASGFAYRENNSLAYQLSSNSSSNWPDNPRYNSTSGPIFYGGTNVLSTRRIRDGRVTHTGIIAADFPGKGLIDSTIALNFPGTLSGDFQIVTALNNSSVLELNEPNNVTLWSNNQENHQRWNFTYDRSENAYVIRSVSNSNLALAWDTSSLNRNVFATPIDSLRQNEYYWVLEKNRNGYIYINKKDLNMVLDVKTGGTSNGTTLQVSPKSGGTSQTFFNRFI